MISFMKRYSGFFLLVIGIIGLMILNIVEVKASSTPPATTQSTIMTNSSLSLTDLYYFVDIKGEVAYPAVYQVKVGTRIEEVIMLAGGLTNRSDVTEINLAKMVYDQMVIYIPSMPVTQLNDLSPLEIYIDIKGAVKYPGVYKVSSDFRVYDAIMRAGGFTQDSDSSQMNLSEKVTDQMIINVPYRTVQSQENILKTYVYVEITGEVMKPGLYHVEDSLLVKDIINLAGGVKSTADISNLNLNQNIVNQLSIHVPTKTTTPSTTPSTNELTPVSNKININTATVEILDTLPGIGYIIAQRIIDYRAEYGNFESIEDIMKVSGIKEAIYAEIKDLICV